MTMEAPLMCSEGHDRGDLFVRIIGNFETGFLAADFRMLSHSQLN